MPVLEDLDQASDEWRLWRFRQKSIRDGDGPDLPASVAFLVWLKELTRLFLLPWAVISATVALLLSAPLTSQNVLLNGLAIGFATVVDDLIAMFFLSREQRLRVDRAVSELEEQLVDVTNWEIDSESATVVQGLPVGEASRLEHVQLCGGAQ